MEIKITHSDKRGYFDYDWLRTRHSFSFGNYYNPDNMQFGMLRVLNEDHVSPGKGFDTHPHKNMEIVTIVLEGELEHQDSMGNQGIIPAGDLQRISAGTGILHSEFNPSSEKTVHLLQIWILPKESGIQPSYEQKSFQDNTAKNRLNKVVSGEKSDEAIYIHQNASFHLGTLETGTEITHALSNSKNGAYLFLISGQIDVNGHQLSTGDAAEITKTDGITLKSNEESKVLLIEVHLESAK